MDSTLRACLDFVFAGPYSSVLPFTVLPPLSAWVVDRLMRYCEQIPFSPIWQAISGAIGASVPGLVTLSLVSFSVHYIPRISPEDFGCYVKIYGPLCIVLILVARALLRFLVRSYRVHRLAALTTAPSERLARLAAEFDIPISELPANIPVCMTVGFFSPRVIISTRALAYFSDDDLQAALLHERAHIVNGHTRFRAAVSFLSECSLLRATKSLGVYGQACEEIADQEAAKQVGAIALADVLVRFARVSRSLPFAEAFAKTKGLDQRVCRLLQPTEGGHRSAALVLLFALLLTASLITYPQVSRSLAHLLFNCAP